MLCVHEIKYQRFYRDLCVLGRHNHNDVLTFSVTILRTEFDPDVFFLFFL